MNCNEVLPNRPVDVDGNKSRKLEKKKKPAKIVEEIPHNLGMESESEDEILIIQHRDRFKKGEEDIESSTDETEDKEIEEVVDVPIVNQQIEESEDEDLSIELNEDEFEDELMESNEEESSIECNEDEELQVESMESDDEESQIYEWKSRRIRNPPNILTYDEIGEPVILHRQNLKY